MSDIEKFEKKLINILNTSSNAKSWGDLLPMSKEILSQLTKYDKTINFAKISTKHKLAKRLAQCLNPEFPNGVHEVILDIYRVLLTNIYRNQDGSLQDNLGIYLSGLFPFFSHASLQNKKKFLEIIIKNILLCLNLDELVLCLPGVLAALIPGLDDNDENTTKLIFECLKDFIDKLNNLEQPQVFFGNYWTLLLRNQNLRTSGMKFLIQNIITYEELIEKPEEEQQKLIESYYPNVNTTIINALGEIIFDKEIPTVRNSMDFIITRFPLIKENTIYTDEAKINLIIKVLKLLTKNEQAIERRINTWFCGLTNTQDEEPDFLNENMKYIMELITQAFLRIFNPENYYSSEELLNNLIILKNFFNINLKFSDYILSKISFSVLKCAVNFWQQELNGSENAEKNKVISYFTNFFSQNNYNELLWISLTEKLKTLTEIKIEDNLDENENIENIKKNPEKILMEKIDENINQLKFCILFTDIKTDIERVKHYIPIITNLLNICKKIKIVNRDSLKNIKQIILITLVYVKNFQDKIIPSSDNTEQISNQLYDNNSNINYDSKENFVVRPSIFAEVSNFEDNMYNPYNKVDNKKYTITEESSLTYILKIDKNAEEIIKALTESILDYQIYFINFLNEYLKIKKDMQITKYEINIFKQFAELILRLQEYSQQNDFPYWIHFLQKIIFCQDINIQISLESANLLLELFSSDDNESIIYKNIKENLNKKELKSEEITTEVLNNIIQKTGAKNNCYELLMGKFYLILLEQNNQRSVIDLLVKIINIDKMRFEQMVLYTLNINSNINSRVNPLVDGIKLFNEFWKLTNELYPDEIFFSSGDCIFKMLDFLENKNPLIRHLSKTWLNQVNQMFNKIFDPLIFLFLSDEINLFIEADKVLFMKEYDTSKILDAFSKMKNIILNSQAIPFLVDERALRPEKINLSKIGNPTLATYNYLCLLITISLRFTQAKCPEEMTNEFKNECFGVNAASCEFLEFLIHIISDDDLLINVANELNRPLMTLLDNAIETKDEVMQVELLATIKALDFNSSAEYENNPDKKMILFALLKQDNLTKILIKGMTSDLYFIRENFLNFIKNCLPIFSLIIKTKEEFEKILGIGIHFISALTKYLAKKINIKMIGRKDNEKFSHFDEENNLIIFKNYLEEYKEYKTFDENDVLLILKGIRDMLTYFLNIEYNDIDENDKGDLLSKLDPLNIIKKLQNLTFNNDSNNLNKFGLTMTSNDFNGNWKEFKKNLVSNPPKQNSNKNYIFTVCEGDEINKDNIDTNNENGIIPKNIYNNHIYNLINGLILTWVNQSDRYEVYDYCLNLNGILAQTEINTYDSLTPAELQQAKELTKKNPIKKVVIEIAFNLFLSNSIQFIEKILDLWCFGNTNSSPINASKDKQFQLSIIELLISMNLPMNVILYCINQILINKLKPPEQKSKKNKKEPKNSKTAYENSLYEAKVFHFIYSYILLNPIYDIKETTEIWKEMINIFYTIIKNSKILYTYCWLYEVMQISLDKFQISHVDDFWFSRAMNDTFNIITNKLMEASFDNKIESMYLSDEKLVFPILPHIYTNIIKKKFDKDNLYIKDMGGVKSKKETKDDLNQNKKNINLNMNISKSVALFKSETKRANSLSESSNKEINYKNNNLSLSFCQTEISPRKNNKGIVSDFYDDYFKEIKKTSEYNKEINNINKQSSAVLNIIYRQLAILTLKENYLKICTSIFGEKWNDNKKQLTEILKGIINLIRSNDSLLKQFGSDFLVILMENIPKYVTKYGKDLIMNYFYDSKFFKTDNLNLHNWKIIISHYAYCYPEIINDLLNKIDDKNIFSQKVSESDKIRILRRISFVIYSCEGDTFANQFDLIKSKAKDLLSGYTSANNASNLIEEEIFLIMRILFFRFSHDGVLKMIRDLWPIIFNELIQNIENEDRNKDVKLVAESFKFIESLSLVNVEEFTLYEWTFIVDTFNMKNLDTRIPNSMINKLLDKRCKFFKPLAINILSKGKIEVTDELLKGNNKGKSEAYIQTKKDTFDELFEGVKKFFYSIVDTNSYKVPFNKDQIEQIIEEDFIDHNLDETK